jgi:hypothetical protein
MKQSSAHRYDYRVRIQVPFDTQDAFLLYYLTKRRPPDWTHEYMVLTALRAYWEPFCYADRMQWDPSLTIRGLRWSVKNAGAELREQAKMLEHRLLDDVPNSNADSK